MLGFILCFVCLFFLLDLSTEASTVVTKPATPRSSATFSAEQAAETLHNAMKGFGTDESAIIDVTTSHTGAQRLQIAERYKGIYGRELINHLKSELSGNFETLVKSLYIPYSEFLAKSVHRAIKGIGTDERTLIEMLCGRTNFEVNTLKKSYKEKYGKELEDDLKKDISGNFKRLLRAILAGSRDELAVPNQNAIEADARQLVEAGLGNLGTDESIFFKILLTRSYAQLRSIFDAYRRISGKDIEDTLKSEFSGYLLEGLLAIVRACRDPAGFYAKLLHKAMSGPGTDDNALIRILITRMEENVGPFQVSINDIKKKYKEKYGQTLGEAIRGETSGDYRTLLLALIGE